MDLNLNNIQSSVVFALFRVITTINLTGVYIEIYYDTSLDEVVQLREAARLGTRTNSHLGLRLSYDNGVSLDATIITEPMHENVHSICGPENLLRAAFDLSLIREGSTSVGSAVAGETLAGLLNATLVRDVQRRIIRYSSIRCYQ
jgi:hypothetical protein